MNALRLTTMACIACGAALALLGASVGAGSKDGTLEGIRSVWKAKESQNVLCEWTERITVPKEQLALERKLQRRPVDGPLPTKDVGYDRFNSITFVDANWRIESKGKAVEPSGALVDASEVVVDSRDLRKSLGVETKVGSIGKRALLPKAPQLVSMQPPFMLFRPYQSALLDLASYQLAGEDLFAGDLRCVILSKRETNGELRKLWLAPTQNYTLQRYVVENRGRVLIKLDVKHVRRLEDVWVPSAWRLVTAFSGAIDQSIVARITRLDLSPSINQEQFNLTFPNGTVVRDFTKETPWREFSEFVVGKKTTTPLKWFFGIALLVFGLLVLVVLKRRYCSKGDKTNV